MVAKDNITVYQGSDYRRALEFKNESAVLMDLTGYVFRGQVRAEYSSASPVFSFSFTLRNQTTSPGLVDMLLSAADTAAVSIAKITSYIYDIEMVTASGDVKRIVEGKLNLHPEVTR